MTLDTHQFSAEERKKRMLRLGKWAALYMSPVIVFVMLMFADVSMLAIANGGTDPEKGIEDYPHSQLSYIDVAIDSTLGYGQSMMRAGLIYDYTDNKLVWEKNLEGEFPIASITKMMVALITMEQVAAGNISMDTVIKVVPQATATGGSRVYLRSGQKVSVEDLLEAAMIRSGNDAAYQLAHFIGGTEKEFVEIMNDKAFLLGMENTHFGNSTGMPLRSKTRKDNYSTPADLMLMARELVKYEDLLEMVSRPTEKIRNENGIYTYENRNSLVKKFDEIDGLKTGYTRNAKYCIVATSERAGHRVISIVLGVDRKTTRSDIVVNLFNNYYKSIGVGKLGEEIGEETAAENSSLR